MKTPEGMTAKPPTTADLLKEAELRVGVLEERSNRLQRQADEMLYERDQARADRKLTIAQFAELKVMLQRAETEVARMTGYVERVREQDDASEHPVIVERTEQVPIPRRAPRIRPSMGSLGDVTGTDFDEFGRVKVPKHWTSYGNG